jgi:alkylmercury lyase
MTASPSIEEYWHGLQSHLRAFAPDDRRAAVALYRELAKGRPVDAVRLGNVLGISAAQSRELLERPSLRTHVYWDDRGRILGFGGLSVGKLHHAFEVDGSKLSTWCAWDSLFIPEILGRTARVTSADPENGESVRLVVTPDKIESVEPTDAVMSLIQPDANTFGSSAANVMAKFCHFVFFFSSPSSGSQWIAKYPGTFLCSLEDGMVLAKRLNARTFGRELNCKIN